MDAHQLATGAVSMNLHQLRCFVLAAEEFHFGPRHRSLKCFHQRGRFVRLLEEDLNTLLFLRTTRRVVLTEEGKQLLGEACKLLAHADTIRARFRDNVRLRATRPSIGTIDSAAEGLLPRFCGISARFGRKLRFSCSRIRQSGSCREYRQVGSTLLSLGHPRFRQPILSVGICLTKPRFLQLRPRIHWCFAGASK